MAGVEGGSGGLTLSQATTFFLELFIAAFPPSRMSDPTFVQPGMMMMVYCADHIPSSQCFTFHKYKMYSLKNFVSTWPFIVEESLDPISTTVAMNFFAYFPKLIHFTKSFKKGRTKGHLDQYQDTSYGYDQNHITFHSYVQENGFTWVKQASQVSYAKTYVCSCTHTWTHVKLICRQALRDLKKIFNQN